MKICMVEPAGPSETGSIGANFVVESARSAGFCVDIIGRDEVRSDYDIELISIHHPSDYKRFISMPRHGSTRVIGGHITYNNPRPVIPFADYLCMGDGETWIKEFLSCVSTGGDPGKVVPGTLDCKNHKVGSPLPDLRYESRIDNAPYLNRAGTRSAAWYIEIARGCPFSCDYCELGNSMPYRHRDEEEICALIDGLDLSLSEKIVFFAPDEASHPAYNRILDYAGRAGTRQCFGSYRIDQVLRTEGLHVAPNQLVRVGVDGMTEDTRFRVKKNLTNKQIVKYFKLMVSLGHANFKIFQMFGHPWEKLSDFEEWKRLVEKIRKIPLQKNVSLRIKWTPLIPQPATPLHSTKAVYNQKMAKMIRKWHKLVARPESNPGWYIDLDGLMSEKSHEEQVRLTQGSEELFL